MKSSFVSLWSRVARTGIYAAVLSWLFVLEAQAFTPIVDNLSSTVPGFTSLGGGTYIQEFTGGGRAGALTSVGVNLRITAGATLDTFIVGTGPTTIQGKQANFAIFDGTSWLDLGGVIVQRTSPSDTVFQYYFRSGTPLSSFSVGGSTTRIRVTGNGIDWA